MMQRLKILGSALIALSFSASAVVAQQFDPKQGYEIHTVNGLVLDNQESLDTNTKIFISKREADKGLEPDSMRTRGMLYDNQSLDSNECR